MIYDFFASATDKQNILDFIFEETNLRIFDSYSDYDQEITEYKNTKEIISKFQIDKEKHLPAKFNLWSSDFGNEILFRKIELNPKYSKGHSFRFASNGWGLIQLYFEELKADFLKYSHLGHFNQKGALSKKDTSDFMGSVDKWDWKRIELTARKLKYHIQNKLAVKKVGSFGILAGANMLEQNGIKLSGI